MPELDLDRVVRRNTLILATTLAVNSAVVQLVAAVSSLTFVLVTGIKGLLGLGPAIFLVAAACTGAVAGRAMDRYGRRPVLIIGFIVGGTGCAVTALGTHVGSTLAVIVGFTLTGSSSATALLVRTAAGDMYPPLRRARGISYVLFGSVFGAILGPTVFSPLFAGKDVSADSLTIPWLAAAAISLMTATVVSFVRPDTKKIAELIAPNETAAPQSKAPIAEIIRRPGVIPAMLTSFASFGVMVSVMNLTGYVVVEMHHHAQHNVFPIIAAHVVGMYALVLVVGTLIDRVGRTPALASGLLVMGASALGLSWISSVLATGVLLFGLGIGWNISYVAAAAQLADLTHPSERGRLFGFNDFAAAMFAAALALLGGLTLETLGVTAMAFGAAVIVTAPAPWLLFRRRSGPQSEAPVSA
ncbi:MAG: MFS transporter [Gaiellaceae bacterium]